MSLAGNYFLSTEEEAPVVTVSVPGWGSGLYLAAKDFVLFSLVSRCCMGQLLSYPHSISLVFLWNTSYFGLIFFPEYLDRSCTWSLGIFNTWKSIAISKVSRDSPRLVPVGWAALLPVYTVDGGERCGSFLLGATNGTRWQLEYTDPVNLWAAVRGLAGWRCTAGTSRAVCLLAEFIACPSSRHWRASVLP